MDVEKINNTNDINNIYLKGSGPLLCFRTFNRYKKIPSLHYIYASEGGDNLKLFHF